MARTKGGILAERRAPPSSSTEPEESAESEGEGGEGGEGREEDRGEAREGGQASRKSNPIKVYNIDDNDLMQTI